MNDELSDFTESFGDFIKRHREASGRSIDEIARTTKISKRYLEAFEANDLNNLPEEAFARGFLKNYAAEIGLDVEDCLDRFERFRRSAMPTQVKEVKKVNKPSFLLSNDSATIGAPKWLPLTIMGLVLVALLVILVWVLGIRSSQEMPVASEASQVIVEEELMTDETGSPADSFVAPIPPSILTLKASETSTVLLRVDEAAAQEVVIEKGAEKSFEVYRQIEIRDFDQRHLQMEYNGKPIEAAGSVIKLFNQNMFSK